MGGFGQGWTDLRPVFERLEVLLQALDPLDEKLLADNVLSESAHTTTIHLTQDDLATPEQRRACRDFLDEFDRLLLF